jgi:hypothetical protein
MDETNMNTPPSSSGKTKIGFHYYPDTVHYRESDLQKWLPELQALKASWLVLQSPVGRAIPEYFISSLVNAGIEPIIQYLLPLGENLDISQINPILSSYCRWGVKNIIFFDRPNARTVWSSVGWVQQDLLDRFIDQFSPLADLVIKMGSNPVLPPLEPGGSYWDTAFLRSVLEALSRREQDEILQNLVLSAYTWSNFKSLNWGAGGPQRWPFSKPYLTPSNSQDQRGFRIFDWYNAVTQSVLQKEYPVILLGAGAPCDPDSLANKEFPQEEHSATNLAIEKLLMEEKVFDPINPQDQLAPLPANILACNYWLLTADQKSPYQKQAWYQPDGSCLPVVEKFKQWAEKITISSPAQQGKSISPETRSYSSPSTVKAARPISHYLLLPTYDWGIADWHLEVIRPFVKKYHPTVGFSLNEASMADRVTVIGNLHNFPEQSLNQLRQSGCRVERISGDGTTIASLLAER